MDELIKKAFGEFDIQKRAEIFKNLFAYHADKVVCFVPLYCDVTITGLRSDRWAWTPAKWWQYPEYHKIKPVE